MKDENNNQYDCYTSYPNHVGCSPNSPNGEKTGADIASNPGVVAVEKTESYIKVFLIPAMEIPADLEGDAPKPDTWDRWVISYFPLATSEQKLPGSCPLGGNTVKSQQIVLNIGLCGEWAGKMWYQANSCVNKVGPKYPSQCQHDSWSSAN